MVDIRLKQTLRDILVPSKKQEMGPRSLAYLRLVLRDKHNDVLFASFPKSGWNWTADVLAYCLVKHMTGDYQVEYSGSGTLVQRVKIPYRIFYPADSRARHARQIRDYFPDSDLGLCFHTHGNWKESPLWGLDAARTVFVVRNIPTMLFSYYKSRGKQYAEFEDVIRDGVLDRAINFYNSWGEYCATGAEHRIYRFEDYKQDAVQQFSDLMEYVFGIQVSRELVAEACDYYSIDNQRKREFEFCPDEDRHFYFEGKSSYEDKIPESTMHRIKQTLNKNLRHNFDYDYS